MTTDNKQPETADVLTSCPRCGGGWGFEAASDGRGYNGSSSK